MLQRITAVILFSTFLLTIHTSAAIVLSDYQFSIELDDDESMGQTNTTDQIEQISSKDSEKKELFTMMQRKFQIEMLKVHNLYRTRHCAQALQLDDKLSISAQNYATKLAKINSLEHSGTPGVGENLYMAASSKVVQISGGRAVTDWYNEVQFYNFNQGGFSKETGHFTQVVWRTSKKLGVGIAFGNGGRSVYVVAQYSPPGNYIGQYQANVRSEKNC